MHLRKPIALFLLILIPMLVHAKPATPSEKSLFESVNHVRKSNGLHALKWDDNLAAAARKHAQEMAKRGAVEHTFPGEPSLPSRATKAGAKFISISENVVRAANARTAHSQFMNSPNHKGNILDPDIDSIGIGAVEHGGELFVVEDFSKAKK
jgi:uncharacterized protein YkwD